MEEEEVNEVEEAQVSKEGKQEREVQEEPLNEVEGARVNKAEEQFEVVKEIHKEVFYKILKKSDPKPTQNKIPYKHEKMRQTAIVTDTLMKEAGKEEK